MAWIGAKAPAGCIFCEAVSTDDDRGRFVVARSVHAFLLLNAFPYTPGHLMAAVKRHVGVVADARIDELADVMALVQRAIVALGAEYRPDGYNIGINQGRAAGAGIEDHLHILSYFTNANVGWPLITTSMRVWSNPSWCRIVA